MLVSSKYPLDEQTNDGETAVAICSQRGHFEILKILTQAAADLNILNRFDLSPLYLALLNYEAIGIDCAEYLVEENAQVFIDGSDR